MRSSSSRLVHQLSQLRDIYSFLFEQLGFFPGNKSFCKSFPHNKNVDELDGIDCDCVRSSENCSRSLLLPSIPNQTRLHRFDQIRRRERLLARAYFEGAQRRKNQYQGIFWLKLTLLNQKFWWWFRTFSKKFQLHWRLHSSQICLFTSSKTEILSTHESPSLNQLLLLLWRNISSTFFACNFFQFAFQALGQGCGRSSQRLKPIQPVPKSHRQKPAAATNLDGQAPSRKRAAKGQWPGRASSRRGFSYLLYSSCKPYFFRLTLCTSFLKLQAESSQCCEAFRWRNTPTPSPISPPSLSESSLSPTLSRKAANPLNP